MVLYVGPNTQSEALFEEQFITHPPSVIALDTETISLKDRTPLGFAIATSPYEAWYFRTYPDPEPEIKQLKAILTNPAVTKVGHNLMFDIRVMPLCTQDYQMDDTNIWDTNVASRLLWHTETRLTDLATSINREAQDAKSMLEEYGATTMLQLPAELVGRKCCNDAMVTLDLYHHYKPQIDETYSDKDKMGMTYFEVEMAVIPILIEISEVGLKINQTDRAKAEVQYTELLTYLKQLCTDEGFNPGSPQQVGYVLSKRGNFLPMQKHYNEKKQQWIRSYRTDEDTLQFLKDPLAATVLKYRETQVLLSRYIKKLANRERMYTAYGLETVVGRTTSSSENDPDKMNMQNVPGATDDNSGLRYLFEPDSGVFSNGDFSQEHLRILAHYSGDRRMKEIYSEPPVNPDGSKNPKADIHFITALALNIERRIAKKVNFGIPYGATATVLRDNTKIADVKQCQSFLDAWLRAYPEAASWLDFAKDFGMKQRKTLPTLFGRQIAIPEEFKHNGELNVDAMQRKSVNYPILGSDGEVMKRALIVCKKCKLPIVLQVHDSIMCDGAVDFPIDALEWLAPGDLHIPFTVERTARWK
jgi:DNA polymerase-1